MFRKFSDLELMKAGAARSAPIQRDTHKEMPSHDLVVIRQVLSMSPVRDSNTLLTSRFVAMLREEVEARRIVTVAALKGQLLMLSLACEGDHESADDFVAVSGFSRDQMNEVLDSWSDRPFQEALDSLKQTSDRIDKALQSQAIILSEMPGITQQQE